MKMVIGLDLPKLKVIVMEKQRLMDLLKMTEKLMSLEIVMEKLRLKVIEKET